MKVLQEKFKARFGIEPSVLTRAPGRLEVLGNHTDYNEGVVISCAIDRNCWFAGAPAPKGAASIIHDARDGSERCFQVPNVGPAQKGDWANYVKGLVVEFTRRAVPVAPFYGMVMSDVPLSAGMSSSAALEIAVAYGLGALNNATFPPEEWARIGQGSENGYVGANTGLLDQFSSIMGKKDHLVFCDFRSLAVTPVAFGADAVFVVANSGVKHNLTDEYNERRKRCEEATAILAQRNPAVKALRDVSLEQLEAVKTGMPILTYRRALHIVGENTRVLAGIKALEQQNLTAFGRLLTQSHQSSMENFENSCPELDILTAIGESLPGSYGARLSGGGFGGISIHLVARGEAETYRQRLATAFQTRTGKEPETMICALGEGAQRYV